MTRKCKSIKKLRQDDGFSVENLTCDWGTAKTPDTVPGPSLLNLPVSLVSVLRTFFLESTQETLSNAVEYSVMWTTGISIDLLLNSESFVFSNTTISCSEVLWLTLRVSVVPGNKDLWISWSKCSLRCRIMILYYCFFPQARDFHIHIQTQTIIIEQQQSQSHHHANVTLEDLDGYS